MASFGSDLTTSPRILSGQYIAPVVASVVLTFTHARRQAQHTAL